MRLYKEAMEQEIEIDEMETKIFKKSVDKSLVQQTLVSLVIVRNLPFSIIQ